MAQGLNQVQEQFQAPPPGQYLSQIMEAEEKLSKAGDPMIHLKVQVIDPEWAGSIADDYVLTTCRGPGDRKAWKTPSTFRGLATPGCLAALEGHNVPDGQLCAELRGLQLFVTYGNEQKMTRVDKNDPNSPFDVPMTITNENGQEVPLNRLVIKGYSRQGMQAPRQAAPAPQQAPYQAPQQAPVQQGYAQPQAPQPGPMPVQGYAPPQQQAPVQYAAPAQQGYAPQPGQPPYPVQPGQAPQPSQGYVPPPQQGYAPPGQPVQGQVANPAWNGQHPPPPPEPPKKRGGKFRVENDPQGQPQ